ncbi:MAG: lysylphosphatidylglycerol synthase transmembrane domain-containing protein [Gaiellaceae bacterium]
MRRALVWSGLLLSLLFGYLAFRDADLGELGDSLRETNGAYLVPAGLALAAGVLVRAWRWQLLFERARRPRFGLVANALLIGYLFNTILPARPGELARVQVLGKRADVSRAEVLATVVLERVYDLFVLIALLAVAAPFLPAVAWLNAALGLGAVLGLALLAAALLVRRYGRRGARILLKPLTLLPAVGEERVDVMAASVVNGLAAVRAMRPALTALLVTALSWLLLAVSAWFLLRGTGIDAGFAAALLVLVATNLALVLPASPAGLGVFEAAAVLALAAFDVGREQALSYALVLHALNALPFVVVGYLALWLSTRRGRSGSRTAS